MEGEAEVLEPPDQGNKGPPRTLGERRVQLDLLLCKVEGGSRWGVPHPTRGMRGPSLSSLPVRVTHMHTGTHS